ncbi:hypothetical protein TB2_028889 [Malus domestica]
MVGGMAIVLYLLGVGGATLPVPLPGVGASIYRRSYSPSVSPRHRRRSYTPGHSPRPRRTSRRSFSPSVSPEPVKRRSRRRYSRSRDLADAGAQGLTGGFFQAELLEQQVLDLCHDLLALGLLHLPREGCYFAYLAVKYCDVGQFVILVLLFGFQCLV